MPRQILTFTSDKLFYIQEMMREARANKVTCNAERGSSMNQSHIFVDINEASNVIMKFIGSDRFDEVVQCINDNAKSGFMTGLSFALSLTMANCKKYLCYVDEQQEKNTN